MKSVIQAKRYESTVGNKAVQEVISAKTYYKTDRGIVVTNNLFTASAKKLAQAGQIELVNRERLIAYMEEYPVLKKKYFEPAPKVRNSQQSQHSQESQQAQQSDNFFFLMEEFIDNDQDKEDLPY